MRISDWSSDVCSSDLHGSQATSNEVSWPLLSWIPERFTDRPTADRTTYSFGVTRPAETCRARPLSRSASPLRSFCLRVSGAVAPSAPNRSEEHTSELQSLMRISTAVFGMKTKNYLPHTT